MGLCAISFTTGWFRGQRKEEEEFSVNLRLELKYMPEKYELSRALTEVWVLMLRLMRELYFSLALYYGSNVAEP